MPGGCFLIAPLTKLLTFVILADSTVLLVTLTFPRERERQIHYVHSASLAYEDGTAFMSEPSAARQ